MIRQELADLSPDIICLQASAVLVWVGYAGPYRFDDLLRVVRERFSLLRLVALARNTVNVEVWWSSRLGLVGMTHLQWDSEVS
jgi:hypothetical protein